jgi:hypothetical protein
VAWQPCRCSPCRNKGRKGLLPNQMVVVKGKGGMLPSGVTVEGGGGERPSLSNLSLALAEGPQAAKKRVEKSGDPRVSADGCLPS